MNPTKRIRHDVRCIGVQAGVLQECSQHPGCLVYRGNTATERRAFFIATDHWKRGDYGPLVTIGEVHAVVADIVSHAARQCRECVGSQDTQDVLGMDRNPPLNIA